MSPPLPDPPLSRPAIASMIVGSLALVGSGPTLGALVGCYTVYEHIHRRDYAVYAVGLAIAYLLPIAFAVWAVVRARRDARAGRVRGSHLAVVGLVLSIVGALLPWVGLALLGGGVLIGVFALWLTSL